MKTQLIGRTIIELDRIDSTNNHALSTLREHALPEGTVIIAHEQLQGRGMRGNTWKSEAGQNLTMSVVLEPRFLAPDCQFQLNMSISLAIHDFLSEAGLPETAIKWPNDLLSNGRKIGGILMESQILQNVWSRCIVGIGLNVNQSYFAGLPKAASMAMETGKVWSLVDVRSRIFDRLDFRYSQLKSGVNIEDEYLAHLYRFNQMTHWVLSTGERLQAKISGVSSNGALELEDVNGEAYSFMHKEIRMSDFT